MADHSSPTSATQPITPVTPLPASPHQPSPRDLPFRHTPASRSSSTEEWSDQLQSYTPERPAASSSSASSPTCLRALSRLHSSPLPEDRLPERLAIAERKLARHDLSPAIRRKYTIYRKQIEAMLDGEVESTNHRQLKYMEADILDYDKLREKLTAEYKHLPYELKKYQRLEVNARYGDYLGDINSKLRDVLEANKLMEENELFTRLSKRLKREGDDVAESRPLHEAIGPLVASVGLEVEHALFCIHEYANRNSLVHCNIYKLVAQWRWAEIGQRCADDLDRLDTFFDPEQAEIRDHWKDVIKRFRDHWLPVDAIQKGLAAGVTSLKSMKRLSECKNCTDEQLTKIIRDLKGKENQPEVPQSYKDSQKRKQEKKLKDDVAMKARIKLLETQIRERDDTIQSLREEMEAMKQGRHREGSPSKKREHTVE
ncbi:hypothetical protein LTR74_004769 [Friedmanniomyces endolithicus]|nr:hypothetical protein LTR74_004769 [Friedmanniomyces endolithicus]